MQLICSNNIGREDILTIGKVYEGKESRSTWFTVTDDKGKEKVFLIHRFSTIQNWRKTQLDKILI